jgi:1-acyl-sn-glycerol-3-phosphate acyltransferase
VSLARLALRASATVGATAAYLSGFEAHAATRPREERTALLDRWVPRWARALLEVQGVALTTRGPYIGEGGVYPGRGPDGVGRVFVLNHRSALDVLVTFAYAEARLVSRADLARWPLIGFGARRIGTLFVDRASMRSGATVLKEMTRALSRGVGIALYPEGTAFPGDEVRPFRPGAFKAAQKTGAEIVPMGLAYADPLAYFGADETFLAHSQRVVGLRQNRAALVAGDPVRVEGRSVVELSRAVHQQMTELVAAARALLGSA